MGGVARVFAGIGIGLLLLITTAYSIGLSAYEEAKPILEREYPTHLYERRDDCDPTCASAAATDTFSVLAGMNRVNFVVYAVLDTTSGPARITVIDPTGDVRYDRVLTGVEPKALAAFQETVTWSAEEGDWTIARSYAGTVGSLVLEVWGEGVPPGTLG